MIQKTELKYPHGITVIGRTTVKDRAALLENGTQNSFQGWLENHYIPNAAACMAMSLLYKDKQAWEETMSQYPRGEDGITYEEAMERLELFEGQTINLIVWR